MKKKSERRVSFVLWICILCSGAGIGGLIVTGKPYFIHLITYPLLIMFIVAALLMTDESKRS